MSLRGALALIGLMLFIAANGTPAAAGRASPPPATVAAGPPAPAVQMQAEQEDDAEPTAQPDAAPSQAEQEDDAEPTAQPDAAPSDGDGIPVAPLLTPDGRLQLDGTVQGPLDLDGWQVTLDPDDGPVFRPEAASGTWSHLGERALPALNGTVRTVVISGTEVLVGGSFTDAGGVAGANKVARWDGSRWRALGAPNSFSYYSPDAVYTLALSGTEVLAGGFFFDAGGVSGANYVARWDGSQWRALGPPNSINGTVYTLVVSGTEVLAGGSELDGFGSGGPLSDTLVAKFSGGTWSPLGTTPITATVFSGAVHTLALSGTEVLAGGRFTDAGGVSGANYVARWDGSQWRELGPTYSITGTVYTLVVSGTEVLAGGSELDGSGSGGPLSDTLVAKFSGGTWSPLGTTPITATTVFGDAVHTLALSGTEVLAGGRFTNAGGVSGANKVARWDGSQWRALGPPNSINNGSVYTLALSGTEVLAGGYFTDAGGVSGANHVAKLSGGSWRALGSSGIDGALDDPVYTVVISGTEVLAGGSFTDAGGVSGANYVARWDGSRWRALGPTNSITGTVYTLVVSGTEVLAGGSELDGSGSGGPLSDTLVAKFSGGTWSPLGTTPITATVLSGAVHTLALSGTEVLAGGDFTDAGGDPKADYLARLSGGSWGALGTTPLNGPVYTLVVSGTEVLVGGDFRNAGGDPNADYLARLSGGSWGALGTTPLNRPVYAIAVGSAGVFAGGEFFDAGGVEEADYVALWDGSRWRALGGSGGAGAIAPVGGSPPVVSSLAVSGNNLYVGGNFKNVAGVAAADYLARWDGSSWSDVGGSGSLSALNGQVRAIAVGANNDLSIGGGFTDAAGNDLADYIVRYQAPYAVYLPLTVR